MKTAFMKRATTVVITTIILLLTGFFTTTAFTGNPPTVTTSTATNHFLPATTSNSGTNCFSGRLIIELREKPLVACCSSRPSGTTGQRAGRCFDPNSESARRQRQRIDHEQEKFLAWLKNLPGPCRVACCCDSRGKTRRLHYRTLFNGLVLDPGPDPDQRRVLLEELRRQPEVRGIYPDPALRPALYASRDSINAPKLWGNPAIKGMADAGRGIKIAILDEGIHHLSPMFSGEGFSYPPEIPAPGLGDARNNNGKIITSRAYFRPNDPPMPKDAFAWPGYGTHGVHVAGIAAGNPVTANYLGLKLAISGVAPAAWLMSYKLGYYNQNGGYTCYTAEVIAALEDAVADGAEVINLSWYTHHISAGGYYDPLDWALVNAARAGVFVALSAGNYGPYPGSVDDPSADYMTVASCTTDATLGYLLDTLKVTGPEPVDPKLTDLYFETADDFWSDFPGRALNCELVSPATNELGCRPWEGEPFHGRAVLLKRGTCDFSEKVFRAQQAGAALVIIYNHEEGGDEIFPMPGGEYADKVAIPSVMIRYRDGIALKEWCRNHPATAVIELAYRGLQMEETPYRISDFSSRGPGTGEVLKPDIAAPGDLILSQGSRVENGEIESFLGYFTRDGTSMAAPHVAGAAALLKQVHPDWPNAWIKSALMTTSRFREVTISEGRPALPLDTGAGCLDLSRAADPGIVCRPASLSFGRRIRGKGPFTLRVTVTNLSNETESYMVSSWDPRGVSETAALPGITCAPGRLELEPGASSVLVITLDPRATGVGIGDLQGYILLESDRHAAHLPLWARIVEIPDERILLIDNDGSDSGRYPDRRRAYTETLERLGIAYDLLELDCGSPESRLPEMARLASYRRIIIFNGDRDGALSIASQCRLSEYLNNGGRLLVWNGTFFSGEDDPEFFTLRNLSMFGWDVLSGTLDEPVTAYDYETAPKAFARVRLDLKSADDPEASLESLKTLLFEQKIQHPISLFAGRNGILPLLAYPFHTEYEYSFDIGTVVLTNRGQPDLELPEPTYAGRSLYASFSLGNVNERPGFTSRAEFLRLLLDQLDDEPSVTINENTPPGNLTHSFKARFASPIAGTRGVRYRWDFGDDSAFTAPSESNRISHTFPQPGNYRVRVEVTDNRNNRAIGEYLITEPARLYFPHIATGGGWETNICIINTSLTSEITGFFIAYAENGTALASTPPSRIPPGGRREIVAFSQLVDDPAKIGHVVFRCDSNSITGYSKFYRAGIFRAAVPATKELNRDQLSISHIASTDTWFSRFGLVNTTARPRAIFLTTDNGLKRTLELAPGEHRVFNFRELFAGRPQVGIGSATITNSAGIIGLELFGNPLQLSGIPLRDQTATEITYPHVADSTDWWTGVVACNCGERAGDIAITAYDENGAALTTRQYRLNGHERLVSATSALGLPAASAWLKLESDLPMTGFELFGTYDGRQLAGYSGIGISATEGILPKLEKQGWTGIAMVNPETDPVTVILKAYDDEGRRVGAECRVELAAHRKIAQTPEKLFAQDLTGATYLRYSASRKIIAFQLNGTSNGIMLDALPALH